MSLEIDRSALNIVYYSTVRTRFKTDFQSEVRISNVPPLTKVPKISHCPRATISAITGNNLSDLPTHIERDGEKLRNQSTASNVQVTRVVTK